MRLGQLVALTIGMLSVPAMLAQSRPAVEQQWAAGKYVVVVKSATSQSGRKEGPSSIESEHGYELAVQEPDANGQKVRVVFSRLALRAKGGGMEGIQHDTDKPAGEDRYSFQWRSKAMIGSPMEAIIAPGGKIGDVSGCDEIVRKAGAADDPMGARTVLGMCRSTVTSALVPLVFHFPEKPLVKGYAWTRNDPMDMWIMGAMKMAQDYKVKGVEDTPDGSVAEIDFTAKNTSDKLAATDEDSAKFAQVLRVEEVSYQGAGTIRVNLRTKMVMSTKLHMKTRMKGTSLADGGNLPFDFATEGDSEVVVTPAKNNPTSSTGPG